MYYTVILIGKVTNVTGDFAAADLAAHQLSLVATADSLVGAIIDNGIVVVQNDANASIYYTDNTVFTGTGSVTELIQIGHATLIGQVNNVTGAFGHGEFAVIA